MVGCSVNAGCPDGEEPREAVKVLVAAVKLQQSECECHVTNCSRMEHSFLAVWSVIRGVHFLQVLCSVGLDPFKNLSGLQLPFELSHVMLHFNEISNISTNHLQM